MADDATRGRYGNAGQPTGTAIEQVSHGLTAVPSVMRQIAAPGADCRLADRVPVFAVPGAEIDFGECGIDVVNPAPARQPAAHISAAPQR